MEVLQILLGNRIQATLNSGHAHGCSGHDSVVTRTPAGLTGEQHRHPEPLSACSECSWTHTGCFPSNENVLHCCLTERAWHSQSSQDTAAGGGQEAAPFIVWVSSRGGTLLAGLPGRSAARGELAVLLGTHAANETGKDLVVFSASFGL